MHVTYVTGFEVSGDVRFCVYYIFEFVLTVSFIFIEHRRESILWSARNFIPYWSQVLTSQRDGTGAPRRRRDPQPRSRGGRHSERDACPGRVSAWGALPDRCRVSELGLPRCVGFVVSLPVIFLITACWLLLPWFLPCEFVFGVPSGVLYARDCYVGARACARIDTSQLGLPCLCRFRCVPVIHISNHSKVLTHKIHSCTYRCVSPVCKQATTRMLSHRKKASAASEHAQQA